MSSIVSRSGGTLYLNSLQNPPETGYLLQKAVENSAKVERLDFEYVVILDQNTGSSLAIGVTEEPGDLVAGRIVCATSASLLGKPVVLHKKTIVKQMWNDRAEVLEYVPQWWQNQLKRHNRLS